MPGKRDLERFPTKFGYPTRRYPGGALKPRKRDPERVALDREGPSDVSHNRTRKRARRRYLSKHLTRRSRRINRAR